MKSKTIWITILGIIVATLIIFTLLPKHPALAPSSPGQNNQPSGTAATGTTSTATQTASSGLTVTFSPTLTYKNSAISFVYPSSWEVGSEHPVISLSNFKFAYENNDVIPMGGAQIDISTTTLLGSLSSFMEQDLLSATIISTSTVSVSGISCPEVFYGDTYTPSIASNNVAIYCVHGNTLWKMYLSYRANDPKRSAFLGTLSQILASVKFQ